VLALHSRVAIAAASLVLNLVNRGHELANVALVLVLSIAVYQPAVLAPLVSF